MILIKNNLTGDVLEVEEPELIEIETPIPQPPTNVERLEALESAVLELIRGGAL